MYKADCINPKIFFGKCIFRGTEIHNFPKAIGFAEVVYNIVYFFLTKLE